MRSESPDPVGVTDIAARLGVKAKTVSEWRRRGDSMRGGAMPAPRWRVSGLDVWDWADVAEWHRCHIDLVVARIIAQIAGDS